MTPKISVVIPALNAESCIADAVRAIVTQPMPSDDFECIVVVDAGTRDRTAEAAKQAGATIVLLADARGRTIARNAGIKRARGEWIAFTDADCVPSRRWLPALLAATQATDRSTFALAGKTVGLDSRTPAARFMDLIGALDAEIYLQHEAMPWAPSGNLACRRADLLAVGGFDPKFKSYEAADLMLRMRERFRGQILHVPTAVVMHRHRSTWWKLWKQQLSYGSGYGQFLLRYADRWPWSIGRELAEWKRIGHFAARACVMHGDANLVQRGLFVKFLAQRIGFISEYFLSRRSVSRPIALERRPA